MSSKLPTPILDAYAYIKQNKLAEARLSLEQGLKIAVQNKDKPLQAIYHANLGIVFIKAKDFKKALVAYQTAERLSPDDLHLKLIIAQIQIEQLQQYDLALKKLERIIKLAKENPVLLHQAFTYLGLVFFYKQQHLKAITALQASMAIGFENLLSCYNINLKLVEILLRANIAMKECVQFLQLALQLAKSKKENQYAKFYQNILSHFPLVKKK